MSKPQVDVLELFSGIGGFRLAMQAAVERMAQNCPDGKKPAISASKYFAVDTSELVNQCYRHNFNGEEPFKVNIETIKLKDLDGKVSYLFDVTPRYFFVLI